jgi:putative ABC transport system permease protein
MQVLPILWALRRRKGGALVVALQITLTLAVVSNSLSLIEERLSHMARPTGLVEEDLLTVRNTWIGVESTETASLTRADLDALRQLPGVEDATAMSYFPLRERGWDEYIRLDPNSKERIGHAAIYPADDHSLRTLGVSLIAGRNFRPEEIVTRGMDAFGSPSVVIVSQSLANLVFPGRSALGKSIYLNINSDHSPSLIVGIVQRLVAPWGESFADAFFNNSVLVPFQVVEPTSYYLVRARAGQAHSVQEALRDTLFSVHRMRVVPERSAISSVSGIRNFSEVRASAYKNDRGVAVVMGVICAVTLVITAAGIVGLTSFWVAQRRRQIGIRRALGATRFDIVVYFLTENMLISSAGILGGATLGMLLNLRLMNHFAIQRMSPLYMLFSVAIVLLLGQFATLVPAVQAAQVSPAEATRST